MCIRDSNYSGYSQTCEVFADSLKYAWDIRGSQHGKALNIVQSILDNNSIKSCKKNQGTGYNYWGVFLQERGFYDKAIEKLELAYNIRLSLKDSIGMASVLSNMSFVESEKENIEKAIELAIKSINILENHPDSKVLGNSYLNLSIIYENNKDENNAVLYNQKALDIFVLKKDTTNIGNAIYQLANKYYNFRKFELSKAKYVQALEIFKKIKDEVGIACLLYTSPSPRDATLSRMPSSA